VNNLQTPQPPQSQHNIKAADAEIQPQSNNSKPSGIAPRGRKKKKVDNAIEQFATTEEISQLRKKAIDLEKKMLKKEDEFLSNDVDVEKLEEATNAFVDAAKAKLELLQQMDRKR